jgi:hypothetical protein
LWCRRVDTRLDVGLPTFMVTAVLFVVVGEKVGVLDGSAGRAPAWR